MKQYLKYTLYSIQDIGEDMIQLYQGDETILEIYTIQDIGEDMIQLYQGDETILEILPALYPG